MKTYINCGRVLSYFFRSEHFLIIWHFLFLQRSVIVVWYTNSLQNTTVENILELSFSPSVFLSVCSTFLSVYQSLLSVFLSVHISFFFFSMAVCLHLFSWSLSFSDTQTMSVCLSCLSVCLSVGLSLYIESACGKVVPEGPLKPSFTHSVSQCLEININ